jgi:hypothetical protein
MFPLEGRFIHIYRIFISLLTQQVKWYHLPSVFLGGFVVEIPFSLLCSTAQKFVYLEFFPVYSVLDAGLDGLLVD